MMWEPFPFVDLLDQDLNLALIRQVPEFILEKYRIVPINLKNKILLFATSDPENIQVLDELKFATGFRVQFIKADQGAIDRLLDLAGVPTNEGGDSRYTDDPLPDDPPYPRVDLETGDRVEVVSVSSRDGIEIEGTSWQNNPVDELIQSFLKKALEMKSSHLGLEINGSLIRVLFLVAGRPQKTTRLPLKWKRMVSRLKAIFGLNVALRNQSQEGRRFARVHRAQYCFFLKTKSTELSEQIVLRFFEPSGRWNLSRLGIKMKCFPFLWDVFKRNSGLVLVAGPKLSGRTTSLHAFLTEAGIAHRDVVLLQDRLSSSLTGVSQVTIGQTSKVTQMLKLALAQNPDVLAVDEIRDPDIATLVVDMALHHVVMGTFQAKSAAAVLENLLNMGIDPACFASALELILVQHQFLKNCDDCRKPFSCQKRFGPGHTKGSFSDIISKHYRGVGCHRCQGSGLRGGVCVFEMVFFDETMKKMIVAGRDPDEIVEHARAKGFESLQQGAWEKVKAGAISLEESLTL